MQHKILDLCKIYNLSMEPWVTVRKSCDLVWRRHQLVLIGVAPLGAVSHRFNFLTEIELDK